MYGAIKSMTSSQQHNFEAKQGFEAYKWLVADNAREMTLLEKYIEHSITRGARSGVGVEEVMNTLIETLMGNDYDEERAFNEAFAQTMSIKSYIYKNAKYAFQTTSLRRKKDAMAHASSLGTPIHCTKRKITDEKLTLQDTLVDHSATNGFKDLVLVGIDDAINKLIKVTYTVYEGFLPLTILTCVCGDDTYKYRAAVMSMLGIEDPTIDIYRNEDVREVVEDLSKFDSEELLSEISEQIPLAKELIKYIRTAVECIGESYEENVGRATVC